MKAWKGFSNPSGEVKRSAQGHYCAPVLVLDASDFPEDYPEIGSEWLAGGRCTVLSSPYKDAAGAWMVIADFEDGREEIRIADLEPIPETVTGEVVGTLEVGETIKWKTPPQPSETFDIVRRS